VDSSNSPGTFFESAIESSEFELDDLCNVVLLPVDWVWLVVEVDFRQLDNKLAMINDQKEFKIDR
jgi:hypothetical protein